MSSPAPLLALWHFVVQAAVQSSIPLLARFFAGREEHNLVGLLRAVVASRWFTASQSVRKQWSTATQIPLELLELQVGESSDDNHVILLTNLVPLAKRPRVLEPAIHCCDPFFLCSFRCKPFTPPPSGSDSITD